MVTLTKTDEHFLKFTESLQRAGIVEENVGGGSGDSDHWTTVFVNPSNPNVTVYASYCELDSNPFYLEQATIDDEGNRHEKMLRQVKTTKGAINTIIKALGGNK